jgi:hypothetical protein
MMSPGTPQIPHDDQPIPENLRQEISVLTYVDELYEQTSEDEEAEPRCVTIGTPAKAIL